MFFGHLGWTLQEGRMPGPVLTPGASHSTWTLVSGEVAGDGVALWPVAAHRELECPMGMVLTVTGPSFVI